MYNNFHYAMSLCQTLYGIDLKEDEFEEICISGWLMIGNKRTKIYKYITCLTPCLNKDDRGKYYVELPCNADIIESITTSFEDWEYTTNTDFNGDLDSASTENYIEHRKNFNNPLYSSGKFLKYERVGNTLYFDKPYKQVNILYRGLVLDEDGLPELTDSEAIALATYCAYIVKFKEGLLTNNINIINLANTLKLRWNSLIEQARTDEYMDQNKIDEILDAKVNWNRKVYGFSYKYLK